MLDKNINVPKKETQDYPPLPENIYQVELLDVTSKENATYDTRLKADSEKEYETVLSFQFTLLAGKDKGESLRVRNVWANFIPAYLYISKKNGKNKLYQIVEALIDRELTQEEEAQGISGEFLNSLIGKQCRIATKHKESGDKVYDNVVTYYPAETQLTPLNAEEKDKAKVKVKDGVKIDEGEATPAEIARQERIDNGEPNPDDIPF